MRVTSALVRAWRRRGHVRARYPRLRLADAVDDLPEALPARVIICIGEPSSPKWLAMDCPCGRGHRILLSLQPTHAPHWQLFLDGRAATVAPSIDRRDDGCRCHFWLERGRVRWV